MDDKVAEALGTILMLDLSVDQIDTLAIHLAELANEKEEKELKDAIDSDYSDMMMGDILTICTAPYGHLPEVKEAIKKYTDRVAPWYREAFVPTH